MGRAAPSLNVPAARTIAVISDTHLPRGGRALPATCLEHLRAADLVVHAGDFSALSVLEQVQAIGPPVAAVHGNVDEPTLRTRLPERQEIEIAGARIGIIHDGGRSAGRLERLRRAFPNCSAVIFGHSHIPLNESAGGFQIFNPGSPTDRRRQPRHTMGIARIEGGDIDFTIVQLDL